MFSAFRLIVRLPYLPAVLLLASLQLQVGSSAWAIGFDEAWNALQKSEEDFVNTGTICEHVARLELSRDFPSPKYQIDIGVSYLAGDQVIGELDVLVLEKKTGQVPVIGEVKCWRDLPAGLKKAQEQEVRFFETLEAGERDPNLAVQFVKFIGSNALDSAFRPSQFMQRPDHLSIGQKGARAVGYDRELEMTLEELMDLRKKLLSRKRR